MNHQKPSPRTWPIAATVLLILSASAVATTLERYTVEPFAVKEYLFVDGIRRMQGKFTIRKAKGSEASTLSADGKGGGCLLVRKTGTNGRCMTNRDCRVDPALGSYGYCFDHRVIDGLGNCWYKPTQKYCKIPADPGDNYTPAISEMQARWELGNLLGDRLLVLNRSTAKILDYRVVACVNGVDADNTPPRPCGEDPVNGPGERIERAGPVF